MAGGKTRPFAVLVVGCTAAFLAGCGREPEKTEAAPRPVRTVTVERAPSVETVLLTGNVQARNEAAMAFRIAELRARVTRKSA